MDLGVRGKGFLIVGGTAGMGLATARVLAAEGAEVALVGRDDIRAKDAASQLAEEHGVTVVPVMGDLTALGRPGKPEEVGELAAFLLSPKAGYLTGALLNIDGGTDF